MHGLHRKRGFKNLAKPFHRFSWNSSSFAALHQLIPDDVEDSLELGSSCSLGGQHRRKMGFQASRSRTEQHIFYITASWVESGFLILQMRRLMNRVGGFALFTDDM